MICFYVNFYSFFFFYKKNRLTKIFVFLKELTNITYAYVNWYYNNKKY